MDVSGMENAADHVWQYLDELLEKDPEGYKKFIEEQMASARAEGVRPGPIPSRVITPKPAFVIKTENSIGKKIFINVTTHDAIGTPVAMPDEPEEGGDGGGAQLAHGDEERAEQRLRYPLSVGELRKDKDREGRACLVTDIIFHPDSVYGTDKQPADKTFLLQVALSSVEQKHNEELSRRTKFPKMKYKGNTIQEQTVRVGPPPTAEQKELHEQQRRMYEKAAKHDPFAPQEIVATERAAEVQDAKDEAPVISAAKVTRRKAKPAPAVASAGKKPEFSMELEFAKERAGGLPSHLLFTIDTPEEPSSSTLDVEVDGESIGLVSPAYRLEVDIPFRVNDADADAVFVRETRQLRIRVPVVGIRA